MGIFHKMAIVVNRTPVALNVRFDGQDMTLQPGENSIPEVAVQYALNQNPIMGTQDPANPTIYGAEFLIGIKTDPAFPCEPLSAEAWEKHLGKPSRLNEEEIFAERYADDPKARMVVHGKGRPSTARSRHEASEGNPGLMSVSTFEADK